MPDVSPISSHQLSEKLERSGLLRCVFVGHEARRKGLARVYDAMARLLLTLQNKIQLTVYSAQTDDRIPAPSLPHLSVQGAAPRDRIQRLFQESDVFLMPSSLESYGIAYIEAMAQGTVPIVPNWEVQREIVDYGRVGIITSGDTAELSALLEELCDDRDLRYWSARQILYQRE